MKKKLYLIGGTMGIGKTAVSTFLKKSLKNAVMLDGDWCWDADPFTVTDETKTMVLDNICHTLNNFIACSAYDNVIFCWVMHRQSIIDTLLSRLDTENCETVSVSLVCTAEELEKRLRRDIDAGIRSEDIILRSVPRLSMYKELNTVRLDVTGLSVKETAEKIENISVYL